MLDHKGANLRIIYADGQEQYFRAFRGQDAFTMKDVDGKLALHGHLVDHYEERNKGGQWIYTNGKPLKLEKTWG